MNPESGNRILAEFGRVIVLAAVLILLFTANLILAPISPAGHAMLLLGSAYALLFTRIARVDSEIRAGYIQSGEGALALLALIIMISFLSMHRLAVAAICVLIVIILEYYMHMVGRASTGGRTVGGVIINLCAAAAGWYAVTRTGTPRAEIERVLAGFSRTAGGDAWEAVLFLAVCIVLYALILKITPEMKLFSQGREFFEITGLRYGRARALFIAARAVMVSGMVLFTGCLAGVEYLAGAMREKNPVADELKNLLSINIFLQAMSLLAAFAGMTVAAVVAVAFSYLLMYLYRRRYPHG